MRRRLVFPSVMCLTMCGAVAVPAAPSAPTTAAAPPTVSPPSPAARPTPRFSRDDRAGGDILPAPAHPEPPPPSVETASADDVPGAPLEAGFPPCPEDSTIRVRRGLWPRTMCVDAAGRPHGPISVQRGRMNRESGTCSAGLRSGVWTYRYGRSVRVESTFVEGRETGAMRVWRDGRLDAEFSKRNGLWEGEAWATGPSGVWRGIYVAGELVECAAGDCPEESSEVCGWSELDTVLRTARPALSACYPSGADEQEVSLTWKILGDGTTSVPLDSPPVAECLLGVLARLKFSRPRGMLCMVRMGFYHRP